MLTEDTRGVFRRALHEGISPTVYHMASLEVLTQILKTNKIMTSVAFGTGADAMINQGKLYYFSTMRSPQSYYRRGSDVEQALITLDGRALAQRYKASPVDYWGPEFRKLAPDKHEMEDRIYTDKPWIPNALRYITAVRVVINPKTRFGVRKEALNQLFTIERKLAAKGIALTVHTDERSFRTIPSKGMSVSEFLELAKSSGTIKAPDKEMAAFARRWPKKPSEALVAFVEVIRAVRKGKKYSSLSKNGRYYADRMRSMQDVASIGTWIHNAKSSSLNRPFIAEIGRAMKQAGAKTLKDFMPWLQQIFA